jgi:hypothetical protein
MGYGAGSPQDLGTLLPRAEAISVILAWLFVTAFYQPHGVRHTLAVSVLTCRMMP